MNSKILGSSKERNSVLQYPPPNAIFILGKNCLMNCELRKAANKFPGKGIEKQTKSGSCNSIFASKISSILSSIIVG